MININTVKLIKGDCLEVMKDVPDKSIDMILCDLPYGTTRCKWDTIIPLNDYVVVDNRFFDENEYLQCMKMTNHLNITGNGLMKIKKQDYGHITIEL